MKKTSESWVPEVAERIKKKGTKGALKRMLGVTKDQTIPSTFLTKIKDAPVGAHVKNPTKIGKPSVKATPLLKKRVNFAATTRKF